ncbi:helix-turn-helix transcriptional regulator [Listeria monocytogenes]|uniref:XRE family transcriptional regulator n=1 Tax=Listeria monocytogenes TaxID=1639 RepID=A0A9P1SZN6_LISMN|nr:helix-turn-helix transcriptional regulator [Listeria monocytogenes]EAC2288969.1 XRE family transcriptional regulator [Listeria monocytogenes]EAC2302903.1 XRE family transcriptional regulator [Listeria monocytogenes]EAC5549411.1 XRE family transcriptional regulator [Listeria monocytogenes]EAC5748236.1 XRE family transcriptional regulator [Listeria monocytogenes]EAC7929664.1 XRE family transcriptional regulator [Listeria monocytogenes]
MKHSELIINRMYMYMRERNITLNRLADLSGITASTLSNIVNRNSVPKADTIYKICVGLNISVHEFFNFPPYNEVEQ